MRTEGASCLSKSVRARNVVSVRIDSGITDCCFDSFLDNVVWPQRVAKKDFALGAARNCAQVKLQNQVFLNLECDDFGKVWYCGISQGIAVNCPCGFPKS